MVVKNCHIHLHVPYSDFFVIVDVHFKDLLYFRTPLGFCFKQFTETSQANNTRSMTDIKKELILKLKNSFQMCT